MNDTSDTLLRGFMNRHAKRVRRNILGLPPPGLYHRSNSKRRKRLWTLFFVIGMLVCVYGVYRVRASVREQEGVREFSPSESSYKYRKNIGVYVAFVGDSSGQGGHQVRLAHLKHAIDYSLIAARGREHGADEMHASFPSDVAFISESGVRVAKYPHILDNVDAIYRLNPGGIKEEVILRDSNARYSQFYYAIQTHGLTITQKNGVMYFYAKETPIFRIPKGWAKDATGSVTNDVTVEMQEGKLVLSVNEPWLYSPDRVFPVVIDPSIEVVPELRVSQEK